MRIHHQKKHPKCRFNKRKFLSKYLNVNSTIPKTTLDSIISSWSDQPIWKKKTSNWIIIPKLDRFHPGCCCLASEAGGTTFFRFHAPSVHHWPNKTSVVHRSKIQTEPAGKRFRPCPITTTPWESWDLKTDPRPLLCTSKPLYRRVQWFLGQLKFATVSGAWKNMPIPIGGDFSWWFTYGRNHKKMTPKNEQKTKIQATGQVWRWNFPLEWPNEKSEEKGWETGNP